MISKKAHTILPLLFLGFFTLSACHTVEGTVQGAQQDIKAVSKHVSGTKKPVSSKPSKKSNMTSDAAASGNHSAATATVIKDTTMHNKLKNPTSTNQMSNDPTLQKDDGSETN